MTDFFAVLQVPRRPWLDPEALKQKFLELSASLHPDRVHHLNDRDRAEAQERYVELNAAYACLRKPKDRLRHLLELEHGPVSRNVQGIPSDLMDFSMEIARVCREADALMSEKARTNSPLLQVQFFERSQEQTDTLRALQARIAARRDQQMAELRRIDAAWEAVPRGDGLAGSLEEISRLFSYLDRWLAQVQERIVRLSF